MWKYRLTCRVRRFPTYPTSQENVAQLPTMTKCLLYHQQAFLISDLFLFLRFRRGEFRRHRGDQALKKLPVVDVDHEHRLRAVVH